ncbi:uncharacterized protein B0I36DRAFT_337191 [Microdochium trichocladiopsis]|uniref:Ankyrin repeat-containing domain protein n=1 Tax=Microdochium trichocladiopsis TaxID=1682393 RepID=A0A9P9BGQ1_9PEZI|nr:uncharacterized protein B0I36DRAFT_337191 [Microdochium trichocladiopsis]KAH7016282.1 hypothetical protein B0I36DRAFT_337191 [Microdochium trichocladiopsis]
MLSIGFAVELRDRNRGREIVEFLVKEAKLDINALGINGTALHLAIRSGDVETVSLLISLGADIHATDLLGQDAFEHAIAHSGAVAEWMAEQYGDHISELLVAKRQMVTRIIDSSATLRVRQLAAWISLGSCEVTPQQKEEVLRAWTTQQMDDKLCEIWMHNFSLAALQWFVAHFQNKGIKRYIDDAAAVSSDLARAIERGSGARVGHYTPVDKPIDGELRTAARYVADVLQPLDWCIRRKFVVELCRKLPHDELCTLGSALATPDAQPFLMGHKPRWRNTAYSVLCREAELELYWQSLAYTAQ